MRTANSLKAATRLSKGMLPLLIVAILLPIIILVGFGVFALFKYGYILHFIALLAICALLSFLPLWWFRHKIKQESITVTTEESFVEASDNWGDYDNQVWTGLNHHIVQQLEKSAEWGSLHQHALVLITMAAERYHGNNKRKELEFTLPELLIMTEEVSRRYRIILESHVPFVENFSLSLLRQGYDNKEKIKSGLKSATWIWNTYRIIRMASPVVAILSEIRGQFIGKVLSHVSSEIQFKLKQALLQEVVSVSIDLYSGRFKVDEINLDSSLSYQADKKRIATPLDPLRICLIGQVSSGKSSLVNALTAGIIAEISALPSTNKVMVYHCSVEGVEALSLVDLPGFDGLKSTGKKLLQEVVNCDLVLWVLKANQPARSLDSEFKALLDKYYAEPENRSLKRPVIIGVLNQVDRLNPINEWKPPYALNPPKSNKEKTIKSAVDYNQELLGFSTLLPMSVSENKQPFNLQELELLLDRYYYEGAQAQLNRRRNEAANNFELSDQAKRIYQTGQSLFKIIKR